MKDYNKQEWFLFHAKLNLDLILICQMFNIISVSKESTEQVRLRMSLNIGCFHSGGGM